MYCSLVRRADTKTGLQELSCQVASQVTTSHYSSSVECVMKKVVRHQ